MAVVPLRHNRDFVLYQAGQLLSSFGTQSSTIAYPLLVLAVTHSPAKTGLVAAARALPLALLALPAGLAADRWGRRRLMIGADVVRALAVGALATLVVLGHAPFWVIPVVALVEGAGAALFSAAEPGMLRAVVPLEQLPPAIATQSGRRAVVQLAGPPVGGALFALTRWLPFVADAVSYACSSASLLAMRTPFEEAREIDTAPLRTRLAEGFTFNWSRPFLRTTAFVFGLGNFVAPGLLLSIVVIGKRHGLSSSAVGLLIASFGACIVVGSLTSPILRRRLPIGAVLLLEVWAWPGCALFLLWPSPYAIVLGVMPAAFVIPSTDSVVHGYRIAMTPDRLVGRVEAVRTTIALSIAPLGPLVAGFLLDVSERLTIGVFAVTALLLAVLATASPAIRHAPRLDDVAALGD